MAKKILISFLSLFLCLGVYAQTTYLVKPDGSGDYPTIQAACTAASPGDTIKLDDGIFIGEGNYEIDFLGKDLVLKSKNGIKENCIINPNAGEWDFKPGFFFVLGGETNNAKIMDITVYKGGSNSG